MQRTVLLLVAAALAVVLVLVAVLRDGNEDAQAPATTIAATTETVDTSPTTTEETTTEETTTAETTTEAEPPPPPPPAPPQPTLVRITIRGGKPVGGIVRQTLKQGERVRIVVRADVADHVHLHGYDIMRDVAPGLPAQIAFRATIPGRFEVELEDRGLQIADLEVRP